MAAVTQCGSKDLMGSSGQGSGSDEQVTKRARLAPEVDSSKEEYLSELLVPSGADNEKAGEEQFALHARSTPEVRSSGVPYVCLSAPAVQWRKNSLTFGTGMPFKVWLKNELSSSRELPPSEMSTCIGPTELRRYIVRKPDGTTRELILRRELPVFRGEVVRF